MEERKSLALREAERRRDLAEEIARRNRAIKRHRRTLDYPLPVVIDILRKNNGNLTKTAEELDVNFADLIRLTERNAELRLILLAAREGLVDMAEDTIREHLEQGSFKAATFVLMTLGKNRGYRKDDVPREHKEDYDRAVTKVDLANLSVEQMQELRDIMNSATKKVIDVTPEKL